MTFVKVIGHNIELEKKHEKQHI